MASFMSFHLLTHSLTCDASNLVRCSLVVGCVGWFCWLIGCVGCVVLVVLVSWLIVDMINSLARSLVVSYISSFSVAVILFISFLFFSFHLISFHFFSFQLIKHAGRYDEKTFCSSLHLFIF